MADHGASSEAANPTISDRVHCAIVGKIEAGCFPVVEYVEKRNRCTTSESVDAKTILVRPVSASFIDSSNRLCGGSLQERDDWIWTAEVHFDRQVSLDAFEEEWMLNPLVIPRDADTGLNQQINIILQDVEYQHPPAKQSSHGNRVTYRLAAQLSPR